MSSFNKVIILGNLTRDPELRYGPSGTAIATFALAVNRKYRQGEETKEEVSYLDIVVFGKQAENCGQYLGKGDSALIEGRLQQQRWQDKTDGSNRSKIVVAAQSVTFMPKRAQAGGRQREPEAPVDDSEIPF